MWTRNQDPEYSKRSIETRKAHYLAIWQQKYTETGAFRSKYGYLPDKSSHTPKQYWKIGSWVYIQKLAYHKKQLSEDQIRLLEKIGMKWKRSREKKPLRQKDWELGGDTIYLKDGEVYTREEFFGLIVDYLLDYKKDHPFMWPKDSERFPPGFPLGRWCNRLRREYRRGHLSLSEISIFSNIGFCFTDHLWAEHFYILKSFVERFNHFPTYREKFPSEFNLGAWFQKQLIEIKDGKSKPERIAKLLSLPLSLPIDRGIAFVKRAIYKLK